VFLNALLNITSLSSMSSMANPIGTKMYVIPENKKYENKL